MRSQGVEGTKVSRARRYCLSRRQTHHHTLMKAFEELAQISLRLKGEVVSLEIFPPVPGSMRLE